MKPRPASMSWTSVPAPARDSLACGPKMVTVSAGSARAANPATTIQMTSTPQAAPQKRSTENHRRVSIVEDMLDFIFGRYEVPEQGGQPRHRHVQRIAAPAGSCLHRHHE